MISVPTRRFLSNCPNFSCCPFVLLYRRRYVDIYPEMVHSDDLRPLIHVPYVGASMISKLVIVHMIDVVSSATFETRGSYLLTVHPMLNKLNISRLATKILERRTEFARNELCFFAALKGCEKRFQGVTLELVSKEPGFVWNC